MSSPRHLSGPSLILFGSLCLAAVSTLGDWIWHRWIPHGQMIHGVVHGTVIFAAIGLVLGLAAWARGASRRAVPLAMGGEMLVGVVVSASFYPLYGLLGKAALFVTWVALWLLTAGLQQRVDAESRGLRSALLRGSLAALGSGLAFWSVSRIWTQPNPEGPNLVWNFACWLVAFAPGFSALLLGRRPAPTVR